MRTRPSSRATAGFTMIELLIAMVITVAIFSMAVPFLSMQARTVTDYGGRLDAQQNARFAFNAIDRELRMAGVGILNDQPMLVYADSMGVTFNADLVSNDSLDVAAVYFNPTITDQYAKSLPKTTQVRLFPSAMLYPDSNYITVQNLAVSDAETISYWVSHDSTSTRTDIYGLWRRVNNAPAALVAKNLIIEPGRPVFEYLRLTGTSLVTVDGGDLPLVHVAVHGSPDDTLKSAWADSIRIVRVRFSGIYVDPKAGEQKRSVDGSIRLLNAGLVANPICGVQPTPSVLTLSSTGVPGARAVTVTWPKSGDQDGGEQDVRSYVLSKRMLPATTFTDIVSQPANKPTYTYTDIDVKPGQSYEYAVVAMDCTPQRSEAKAVLTGVIPNP